MEGIYPSLLSMEDCVSQFMGADYTLQGIREVSIYGNHSDAALGDKKALTRTIVISHPLQVYQDA